MRLWTQTQMAQGRPWPNSYPPPAEPDSHGSKTSTDPPARGPQQPQAEPCLTHHQMRRSLVPGRGRHADSRQPPGRRPAVLLGQVPTARHEPPTRSRPGWLTAAGFRLPAGCGHDLAAALTSSLIRPLEAAVVLADGLYRGGPTGARSV